MTASSGSCSVIADQAGDANYAAAPEVTETTAAASANGSVSVASSLNPSAYGQSVTFTATITSDTGLVKGRRNGKRPMDVTGNVTWSDSTGCGTTAVTSTGPGSSTATCTTSTLAAGTDTVTASYGGDANHNGGSGSVSQVVNASNGNVSVTSSLNPSKYGQSVTFTATVTGDNGMLKHRNGAKPMDVIGTVSWSANTGCADSTVSGYPGVATCTTSILAVGTDTVTANYGGDANHNAGSGSVSQVVNSATSSVSVGSSHNPSTYGQSVTFTASINASIGSVRRNGAKPKDVSGTVTWSDNTGCGTTTVTAGTATCTTSGLNAGTDTVTADYSGDSTNGPGSGSVSQVVNQASQTITVTTLAPATAAYNSSFTVAATASSSLAVSYTSAGSCSNVGATYTMNSGSGSCLVSFSQAGNSNYSAAATINETTNATKASQVITVTVAPPPTATKGSIFTIGANASSGLAITFAASGKCTVAGMRRTR